MNKERFISKGKLTGYAIINPDERYLSVTRRINKGLYLQLQMRTGIAFEYNLLEYLYSLGKKPRLTIGQAIGVLAQIQINVKDIKIGLWQDESGENQTCIIAEVAWI
jgi:hypothetical protein